MVTTSEETRIVKPDRGTAAIENALTVRDVVGQVNRIQEVMRQVMKQDVHFGRVPGCEKPSLLKPGAEKIAVTFRISVRTKVQDLSGEDFVKYRVSAEAFGPDGNFLGEAIGECSSSEEKYKWRKPVCDQEFQETDPTRRRSKWRYGQKGSKPYQAKQVRTEPDDVANTILQMADKRAFVAVIRKVTAASDIFTQDVEDLPDGLGDPEAPAKPPVAEPQRASAGQPAAGDIKGKIMDLLVQICDGDPDQIQAKILEITAYEKGGQKYAGKNSLNDCSTKMLGVVYGKLKEQMEAAGA